MARIPNIKTAIPKRRYALGEFSLVLLGEIESADPARYEHIMAAVREGDSQPLVYVISERASRAERDQGSHRLRLITGDSEQVLGVADRWRDRDAFAEQALDLVRKALMLTDEAPARLQ